MSTFSVDDSALEEIRRLFVQAHHKNPVARLYESADAGSLFRDVESIVIDETKTEEDLRAIGKKRFDEVSAKLNSSLKIGICDRADFKQLDLHDVGDITFVMPREVVGMLFGYRLVFESCRFSLRDADNTEYTLRSIFTPTI
jgi:hypothetical protein